MKKLLIVDDDKLILSIFSEKFSENENLELLIATSYKGGVEHIVKNKNNIHAAIIDLNLPDAEDGEMANYTLSKKIPTVILTGKYNKSIKNTLLKYDTLDFITKDCKRSILNSIFTIKRILNNYDTNVLVVDDSKLQRNILKNILKAMYLNVFTAKNGKEALMIIENSKIDFSLVITDYNMPFIDGMELIAQLREDYNKDQLGIIALSSNNMPELSSDFIKIGANDYINKPYTKIEVITRVNSILDLLDLFKENREMAFKDFLTNSFNRRYFFTSGQTIFNKVKRKKENIAIAMIDIDNFKSINDNYGHDVGDISLKTTAKILKSSLRKSDLIARFGGEEFCIMLENISYENCVKLLKKLKTTFEENSIEYNNIELNFTISIGLYYGKATKLTDLIKFADKALITAKNNGKNQMQIYKKE